MVSKWIRHKYLIQDSDLQTRRSSLQSASCAESNTPKASLKAFENGGFVFGWNKKGRNLWLVAIKLEANYRVTKVFGKREKDSKAKV